MYKLLRLIYPYILFMRRATQLDLFIVCITHQSFVIRHVYDPFGAGAVATAALAGSVGRPHFAKPVAKPSDGRPIHHHPPPPTTQHPPPHPPPTTKPTTTKRPRNQVPPPTPK